MMILVNYYTKSSYTVFSRALAVQATLKSAINYTLSDTLLHTDSSTETLPLVNKGITRATVHRYLWGLFEVADIKVYADSFTTDQCFFYGSAIPGEFNACIYVPDHQGSVFLAGTTTLTGKAFVPKGELKRGVLGGKRYNKSSLLNGTTEASSTHLPGLSTGLIEAICKVQQSPIYTPASNSIIQDSLIRSFADSAMMVQNAGPIYLDRVYMKGQIVIRSNTLIEVSGDTKLEDVLLIAPVIRFRKNFTGAVQAIAKDSLLVEEDCNFRYPSAFLLFKGKTSTTRPLIRLEAACSFSGIMMAISSANDAIKALVKINDGASLQGLLYTNGYTFLKGKVDGCVATDYFTYKSYFGEYENYLVNVTVDRSALPDYFALPSCFGGQTIKRIMKWQD